MMQEIAALRDVAPRLSDSDRRFADSLLKQAAARGLSPKQLDWVTKLTHRATNPNATAPVEIAGLDGIIALLDRAREHLKYPKLLVRANGHDLRLSLAGDKSKVPGAVNVTGTDDARSWYGRVRRDGTFEPSRGSDPETATNVVAALKAMALDPAGTASAYGRVTGACCFCGLLLSDVRSTDVGYGPICADNWGLPWGGGGAATRPETSAIVPANEDGAGLVFSYGSSVLHRT